MKRNYIIFTVLFLAIALAASLTIATSNLPTDDRARALIVFGLFVFNLAPGLWWWLVSQGFQEWLATEVEDKGAREYETERFKINADHAKSIFAATTGLCTALILKLVLGGRP